MAEAGARRAAVHVCVNRTCSKQGARQTLAHIRDGAPDGVRVRQAGCLGQCGRGPNVGVEMEGGEAHVRNNVATPASCARLLAEAVYGDASRAEELETHMATVGRARALASEGDDPAADEALTALLEEEHVHQRHVILELRAAARRRQGLLDGALADAEGAMLCAPPNHGEPWVQRSDALAAQGEVAGALAALVDAGDVERELRSDPRYRKKKRKLLALQQQG